MRRGQGNFTVLSFSLAGTRYGLAVDEVARVMSEASDGFGVGELLGIGDIALADEELQRRGVALEHTDSSLYTVLLPEPIELRDIPVEKVIPHSKSAALPYGLALIQTDEGLVVLLDTKILAARASERAQRLSAREAQENAQ